MIGPSERPIGTTALDHIDHRHRTAEFSIGIGEEAFRGHGYGTEATRLMMDYAFSVLGLANVMLIVYEFNRAGRRAYKKAGFRECGCRHGAHWKGGRSWDVVYRECLASEFVSPLLGQVFLSDHLGPSWYEPGILTYRTGLHELPAQCIYFMQRLRLAMTESASKSTQH